MLVEYTPRCYLTLFGAICHIYFFLFQQTLLAPANACCDIRLLRQIQNMLKGILTDVDRVFFRIQGKTKLYLW